MNNKKKLFILFFVMLLVIVFSLIAIIYLLTRDISIQQLGPSPFKVDETMTEENNIEYNKLIEIGKSIVGEEEFDTNYNLDLNNPQPAIEVLQVYIQKNKINLDDETLTLFKNFKLPKPSLKQDDKQTYFFNIIKFFHRKIMLEILLNDFENAKKDLIYMNQVNEAVLHKPTDMSSGFVLISGKSMELKAIGILVNSTVFTIDQKLEILEISQGQISSQYLKNIAHFESESFYQLLLNQKKDNDITLEQRMFRSYYLQPNKSTKFLRNSMIEFITKYESPTSTYDSFGDFDKTIFSNVKFYTQNSIGIVFLSIVIPVYKELPRKMERIKNICNLYVVAKEILLYKKKTGSLPKTLEELSLGENITIDKCTGKPFLYFAENGILQHIFGGKNDYNELTTKKLTPEEIKLIIHDKLRDDIVFYLK